MITKFKLFEKESTDEIWREKAYDFYDKLQNILKNNLNLLEDGGQGSFALRGEYVDEKYNDLILLFTHENDTRLKNEKIKNSDNTIIRYAIGTSKSKKVILCANLLSIGNTKYIDSRLDRKLFIHEFIHYLDTKYRYNGITKKSVGKNIKNYYNDPGEYNAHYQEEAGVIRKFFKDDKYYTGIKKWSKVLMNDVDLSFDEAKNIPFPVFKNKIIKWFSKDWIDNMNDKYKRKFNKRLYNLYTTIKNELFKL